MAELLRNPDSMDKLKAEIVKNPSRAVEEDDLNELKYLQAVVKETMGLSSAATEESERRYQIHGLQYGEGHNNICECMDHPQEP